MSLGRRRRPMLYLDLGADLNERLQGEGMRFEFNLARRPSRPVETDRGGNSPQFQNRKQPRFGFD